MATVLPRTMTSDEFIAWAMEQPDGRVELFDGAIVRMQAERLSHARGKSAVLFALKSALLARSLEGDVLGDGMAVEIDARTAYEPDVLVRCGPEPHPDTVKLTDPVIVVEVVSPSSRQRDAVVKQAGYLRVASIRHDLVVTIESRSVTHHHKDAAGRVRTRTLEDGTLTLDPPGLAVEVTAFFA
jgi:Uma2 family endonuclease